MRVIKFDTRLRWRHILAEAAAELVDGKCFGWAASLAFYSFLALFPALLFLVSLAGVLPVDDLLTRIVTILSRVAPGDVVTIARRQFLQIARAPHVDVLILSLLAAVWSTSSGMLALVDTLNQARRIVESRPWWRVRLIAVALTVALTVGIAIAFAVVMTGPRTAGYAAEWLGLEPQFLWTWRLVQWPLGFALVVAAIGCIYHFAPDGNVDGAWITAGSVAAATLWVLVTLGFRLYVSYFADYQKTYGAIGGVIVALLWFYFTSLALLIGAQLDASIDRASASARS